MHTVAVSLSDDIMQRLAALAGATGNTVEGCLALAVSEFVETWETHLADVHQIDENEARAVLKTVNE